jgi:predicted dehydrogenase
MQKKIRTAILGYGRSGSTMHAGGVENNDTFQMVAVCDIDPERRNQAQERFGCAVYDNHHQMLEKEELDLVCVITRSAQHCPMTIDCLDAGVDVLVTKPWAVSAAEGQSMIAAEKRTGRRILPWLPARWGSDLRRLRELVAEGAVGKPFMIRRAVASFGTRNDWQTEKEHGGGYVLNWGPHIVDTAVQLAGCPVRTAFARLGKVLNPGDGEDFFFSVLALENDVTVVAEYAVCTEDLPNWFVQGDRGTIVVRGKEITIHSQTPAAPGDPTRYSSMKAETQQVRTETLGGVSYGDTDEVYAEIATALTTGKPFPVLPAHALELSRVFDAIKESGETGKAVHL